MKASCNGVVIAQSDDTVLVEGSHYFPLTSLDQKYVTFSNHKSRCRWKGEASYLVSRRAAPKAHCTAARRAKVAS